MILQKLKTDAEAYLGRAGRRAVITVPAYFNDAQRQATKDAGKIAGLDVKRIINEPTAAALAYGLDKKKNEKIAVFDLGGGTFDVSVLEVGDGVFEVKSTAGDTHLGGDDFDQRDRRLARRRVQERPGHRSAQGPDGPAASRRGGREGEDRALDDAGDRRSTCRSSRRMPSARSTCDDTLTRAKLRGADRGLMERSTGRAPGARGRRSQAPKEIDEVVLVGGMTRMPRCRSWSRRLIRQGAAQGVNPDEVVAVGAAIQAGVLRRVRTSFCST